MKKIYYFAFVLVAFLTVSCSEDENSSPSNNVDDNEYFNYKADGEVIPVVLWTAIRTEDSFEVLGQAEDGRSIFFAFNALGDFERASSTPATESSAPWLNSHYEYASNYFDFEIVAIDEEAKVIKVNYSGNLYEEEYLLSSRATAVEGTFNVNYTDVTPTIPGIHLSARIEGENWHSVKSSASTIGMDNILLEFNSDDVFKISLNFNNSTLTEGTYNFTNSAAPSVELSRYIVATQSYTDFPSTGTLVITQKTFANGKTTLAGTFSFTAVDPESEAVYDVTSGSFKTVY